MNMGTWDRLNMQYTHSGQLCYSVSHHIHWNVQCKTNAVIHYNVSWWVYIIKHFNMYLRDAACVHVVVWNVNLMPLTWCKWRSLISSSPWLQCSGQQIIHGHTTIDPSGHRWQLIIHGTWWIHPGIKAVTVVRYKSTVDNSCQWE